MVISSFIFLFSTALGKEVYLLRVRKLLNDSIILFSKYAGSTSRYSFQSLFSSFSVFATLHLLIIQRRLSFLAVRLIEVSDIQVSSSFS